MYRRLSFLAIFLMVLGWVGCSPRQRLMKAVRTAEALLNQADKDLMAKDWEKARGEYEKATVLLKKCQAKPGKIEQVLLDKAASLSQDIALRASAFDSPEGSTLAFLRIAGSGKDENLLHMFWSPEGMVEKAMGEERWRILSQASKDQFIQVAKQLVLSLRNDNMKFYANVVPVFKDKVVGENRATLSGPWTYGNTKLNMSLELTREGPIWRMMDFTSDLFGSSLSTVFAMSLADLEMLRPIEETLALPNASDILEKSFRMVLEKGIMKSSTKNPVVFTKKTCNLETADGLSYEIGDQAMVELLGQKRVVNGQVQVLARPFVYTQRDAKGQLIYYNKLEGWMPEEALPSTGEEDVWGTEQSSEAETQEEP